MTKYLALVVSTAALAGAADFTTGQAARAVIGQVNFTAQTPGASDVLLGAVSGLAFANDMLVVADANRVGAAPDNHRVLIFRNLSASLPRADAEIAPDAGRCPVCTGRANVVLGQADFGKAELVLTASATTLRLPTAVATDGRILVVADTDNNRVLIWRSIPTVNQQPADLVLGQPDFKTVVPNEGRRNVPTNRSFRGPQGVWLQNGKLFVADTQNHRVLIWNSVPTQNFQPADVVVGQPNFTTPIEDDLGRTPVAPKATTLLNPVAATSDGQRLFVADLGHNRVLMWNSIPTQNQAPADLALGQPDLETAVANNSKALCDATGKDDKGENTYPLRCAATLNFPRYALSDGRRVFVSDGGNDRVLVYNNIPTASGYRADVILGQPASLLNQNSDSANPLARSSSDSVRTPMSLAWDGTNLFVSDPFNRRVLVFSAADFTLPYTGVRNAASREVYAVGSIALSGTVKEGDEITLKVGEKEYKYKIVKDDTFAKVITALVAKINAGEGDPLVFASPIVELQTIILTARPAGIAGNDIEVTVSTSKDAQITAATSSARLSGGGDAAKVAPGTLVTIVGENLSDGTESAPPGAKGMPLELAGTQVYFDGMRAPLSFVSPGQINAQVPFEVNDASSINAWVRTRRRDGRYTVTTAIAVPVIPQNPGIFAEEGPDPRPAVALHYSSRATGTVSVDGTAKAGDTASVKIEEREYVYTVKEGDTLESVRDGLIALINQDPKVEAFAAGLFTRIRLRARVEGPEGNGIAISGSAATGAQVIITPTNSALCCANVAGSRVTDDNPALPGETLVVYATGLGFVKPEEAKHALTTGFPYIGPALNEPNEFVSSLAGGKTANVLFAGAKVGEIGLYEVHLELNSDLPSNPRTQVTIAQDVYVSNIVTFPVKNPKEEPTTP